MAPTDERVKVTIRLPGPLVKAAKIRAVETDMDLQDYVAECLAQCLRKKGGR